MLGWHHPGRTYDAQAIDCYSSSTGNQSAPESKTNDLRLQAVLMNWKLKKTANYILRFTMQLVTSPASLSVKYHHTRSGVRFAESFQLDMLSLSHCLCEDGEVRSISYHCSYWDDVGRSHAPKEPNNYRKHMPAYAVWKIHPVIKLSVQ